MARSFQSPQVGGGGGKPLYGGGGTPLYGLGMCGPKGHAFSAVLV